jgi:hypothetical protein
MKRGGSRSYRPFFNFTPPSFRGDAKASHYGAQLRT